jgi:hypothetical protein
MAEELINPDDFGEVLDTDVAPEEEELTPESLALIFDKTNNEGNARTNDMATQNAMIQGRGTDLATINLAKADNSASASLDLAAEDLFLTLEGKLSDAGSAFNEIAPDQAKGVLEQMVKGQEAVNSMRTSPVSREMAVIQRAATVPLEQSVRERLAAELGLRNEISRIWDEQGTLDFITDIAGQTIPFRMGQDWEDVKTAVTEHAELKSILDGSSIEGLVGSWQALSPERIKALTPALVEAVLAATGVDYSLGLGIPFLKTDKNVLSAAGILLRFMQPEGGERALEAVQVISAVDVLSLGIGSTGKTAVTASTSASAGRQLAKLGDLPLNTRKIMEGILGNATEYARKKHNPVKLIAQAGDTKEAAKLNLRAVTDEEMAKAYGMPSDVAYTNTMPARASSMNPEFIQGLVSETAEMMNDFIRGQQGFVRSMTTESELLRLGVINQSERAVVVRSFLQDMERKSEDLMSEGIHLVDVKVVPKSINAQGFSYEYTIVNTKQELLPADGGAGVPVSSTHTAFRSWRVDEVTGNFTETTLDLASPSSSSIPGQSPAAWSVTKPGQQLDFNDTIKQSIALEDLAVATKSRINEQWLSANESISGLKDTGARGRIESIELAGDEYINKGSQIRGKVFTENELIAGIKTGNGTVFLTKQNEVEAYFKRRIFADSMWDMQNYVTRRELQIAGFNNSISVKGQQLAVKSFDTPEAALMSVSNRPNYAAWLNNEQVTTLITPELIAKQYDKGRVLVRSHNDWNVTGAGDLAVGGEVVEYIFIEANRLRALPEQVLHYKIAYVPKINEGVEFVVKQKFPVTKQGVNGHTIDQALRAFSSKQDAMTFKAQQVAIMAAKNPTADPADFERLFDIADGSAMKQMERMESALSGSGGLYTGTRSVDDLLMGLDGVKLGRLAPGESYGRYIDHMGNALARNEWRIGQEKQWLNTVAKMDSNIKLQGFNGTRLPDTPVGKALQREREYLNTVNRVPSRQESMFEGAVQKYHDWALNGARTHMGLNKNSIKHALWLKHFDPIAAALTANMHLMLGSMNPAQIYVQASAAVVALSLVKISNIPGVISTAIRFGVMDNIKDGTASASVYKRLVAAKEANAEEVLMYDAWKRSGLLESVRSNADMNYISSTGVGITADVFRRGGNASLLFYRAGELMNRRISFASAFSRWRAENVGKEVTDDALLSIIQEANKTMMELNAANKAWWQGGAGKSATQRVFSMTGQFQQVLAKTVELSLKGEKRGGFNARQKSRIASGQLMMFGAAGVPLISVGVAAYFDWIGHNPTPEEANAVNQGMTGVITKQVFGADIDVANRAALMSGTFETVRDIVTSKDPMWQKFMAVTGTSGIRAGEAVGEASEIARSQAFGSLSELSPFLAHNRASETDMSEPTMLETFADMATVLAKTTTTGRNALKARMMHNAGKILDRRGRVVVDEKEGEFSFADKVGVALGFQLTRETSARLAQQGSREIDEEITEAADMVVAAYHRYVYTHEMNPKYAESVTNMIQLAHETLDNEWKINKMMEQVNRKLFTDSDSLEAREMKKFFERTVPEKISEGVLLDTTSGFSPTNVFNKQAIVQPFQRVLEEENK